MKFTKIALTLMCTMVLFCGCAKDSDIVLKVNDKAVTRAEFYNDYNKIKDMQLKNAPKELQNDNSYLALAIKKKYLEEFISRTLVEEEISKRNIQVSEQELKDKKASIIASMGSEEQLNTVLKQNNISEEKFNSDMKSEVRITKLINSMTSKKATDADALKFYKENKAQFIYPERVRCSHILFETNADAIKRKITDADKEGKLSAAEIDQKVKNTIAENEKTAKEVRNKLVNNPKQFAEYAKKYSSDKASAVNGGDLGFIAKDQVVKEFGDAAFSQKVGVVGDLVKSQYGLHIILVKDKAAKQTQSYKAVKNDLKTYLTEKNKVLEFQKFLLGLKSKATIEFLDNSLKPDVLDELIKKSLPKQKDVDKFKKDSKSKENK